MDASQKLAWLWCPVSDAPGAKFQHPADIAQGEELAEAHFVEGGRGPKLARLSAITLLSSKTSKPNTLLVARHGATQEVPRTRLLPWHEGLLLIQELTKQAGDKSWLTSEHKDALEGAKGKLRFLSTAKYVESRLIDVSLTGATFIDNKGRESHYRRDHVLEGAKEEVGEDNLVEGFFKIEKICRYMPPWEAFCHPKCGYYQDFYQVRWSHPYSEVDYSQCENGCADLVGSTWEPDECLPACLDRFRVQAKRNWHAEQLEREMQTKRLLEEPATPAVKKQCTRRDGEPLEKDLLCVKDGHDFIICAPETLATICKGWPTRPADYPAGFGVADPPGFCWEGCNCMDDMRIQDRWETRKAWIEDSSRARAAKMAMDSFGQQKQFVKRRGDADFESVDKYMFRSSQPQALAALDLADVIQQAIKKICTIIPLQALCSDDEVVCLPAHAFIQENFDTRPLQTSGTLDSGAALPTWLMLDAFTGELRAKDPPTGFKEAKLRIKFQFAKAVETDFLCSLTASLPHMGVDTPWAKALPAVIERFSPSTCAIDSQIRAIIQESLLKVYDFRIGTSRDVSLKRSLDVLSRCLRMLRSASVANLTMKP